MLYGVSRSPCNLPLSFGELSSSGRCCPVPCAGAQAAGCDSLFIAGGIHADKTGVQLTRQNLDVEGMESLFRDYGTQPTFITPYLQC